MLFTLHLTVLPLLFVAPQAVVSGNGNAPLRAAVEVHIEHPCPTADAELGSALAPLHFNADGNQDLAVGARGADQVLVFRGPLRSGPPHFGGRWTLTPDGAGTCATPGRGQQFGYALAAGQLDDDPEQELVVGAPQADWRGTARVGLVYVFGVGGAQTDPPLVLASPVLEAARFGDSVVCGDFNNDGADDVAVGSSLSSVAGFDAGSVALFYGPLTGGPPDVVLRNPAPVRNAHFGHALSVGDANGDGANDLYVSAIFNTARGLPMAGQIYVYPGPLRASTYEVIEDPVPSASDQPFPRFGMDIAARDNVLVVGASRKDWNGVLDCGLGYRFVGPNFGLRYSLHAAPQPGVDDLLGFRALIANVVGDAVADIGFVALRRRELLIWDGNHLAGPPRRIAMRELADDHWANGLAGAQLIPGGYEELVFGSMRYDTPDGLQNVGRVTIVIP